MSLIKKLLYRSINRGCKETDFLIGEFAKENLANFSEEKLNLFSKFILEDDTLLYDWITNKVPCNQEYQEVVNLIREFHKL